MRRYLITYEEAEDIRVALWVYKAISNLIVIITGIEFPEKDRYTRCCDLYDKLTSYNWNK